jgi:DNA-binding transcriptional ArsR family regulator
LRAVRPDLSTLRGDLRQQLIDLLGEVFPAQVYSAVSEFPGATIGQVAERIGESPRRVRHQIERMVDAGLLVVDSETPRRNARERHYRSIAWPRVIDQREWTESERQAVARSFVRLIVTDIGRAVRGRGFGVDRHDAEVRIPGEVDERGREELAVLMRKATEEIEATMIRSAARLVAADEAGTEVVSALLVFEGRPWPGTEEPRTGPRPSQWLPDEVGEG